MIRLVYSTRGVTLIELMIAATVAAVLMAALFAMVAPARRLFAVQPDVQDLQQRLRVSVEALQRPLLAAGAGIATGPLAGGLHHYLAAVRPYRMGQRDDDAAAGIFHRDDRLSIMTVRGDAALTTIQAFAFQVSDATATLQVAPNCPAGLCGFAVGTAALVVGRSGHACWGTIDSIAALQVTLQGAQLDCRLEGGGPAALVSAELSSFALGLDRATGTSRLLRYDGRVTESPVVDHIESLAFEYHGDPSPPQLRHGSVPDGRPVPATTYGPVPPLPDVDDPTDLWNAGENCVFMLHDGRQVPRLPQLAASAPLIVLSGPMLADGPWCPDEASPGRFDADLLRVRRVRVRIRARVANSLLRRTSAGFSPAGISASGVVADQEVQFEVSPRNLAALID